MRPAKFSYIPADNDTNGFEAGITGAGPFTMTVTTPDDGLAHLVSIDTGANLSGITFTLTGTDADGIAQTEAVTGPNATTGYSAKYFKTLTTVTASSTLGANTADIGWKDDCVGPTFPLNWRQESFAVSLGVNISGTINFTVEHCFDDIRSAAPSTLTWWAHSTISGDTADVDGNYAFPVSATRLHINSLTAGATIDFHVVQGR